ncbi:MAG: hypothetical protein ACE5GE_16725, partial [Phycisphaerae bacterium]
RTMLQSAQEVGVSPRALSFTAAMQSIAASWLVSALSDEALATMLIDAALTTVATHVVGNRPDRVEPRAVKRRPKEHALLTKPRAQARAELLYGHKIRLGISKALSLRSLQIVTCDLAEYMPLCARPL